MRRLDHHCWWLGNCVGVGNHRLFVLYLLSQATFICYLGIAVLGPASPAGAPLPAVAGVASIACVSLCAILGLLSVSLLAFQVSLTYLLAYLLACLLTCLLAYY